MTSRLSAKPGGDCRRGDHRRLRDDSGHRASSRSPYLVFNTINNLTTQDAQVDCCRNAADHLEPGGCFVIEVGVPELRRLPRDETAVPFRIGPTGWAFDTDDTATQAMSSNYVTLVDGRPSASTTLPVRVAFELDLMAGSPDCSCATGGRWTRKPFTHESDGHMHGLGEAPPTDRPVRAMPVGAAPIRSGRSGLVRDDSSAPCQVQAQGLVQQLVERVVHSPRYSTASPPAPALNRAAAPAGQIRPRPGCR